MSRGRGGSPRSTACRPVPVSPSAPTPLRSSSRSRPTGRRGPLDRYPGWTSCTTWHAPRRALALRRAASPSRCRGFPWSLVVVSRTASRRWSSGSRSTMTGSSSGSTARPRPRAWPSTARWWSSRTSPARGTRGSRGYRRRTTPVTPRGASPARPRDSAGRPPSPSSRPDLGSSAFPPSRRCPPTALWGRCGS